MDPFSILGLVGTALKGVITTKEWIEGIRRAPQSIAALSGDLRAIERLLDELGSLLKNADGETRETASRLVRDAVNNCEDVSRQIEKMLRPFVTTESGNISAWKRFTFNFRESDVLHLQREMAACKQTLNMAIGCANLLATQRLSRGMKRVQRHFGIVSSSVADSDIAERKFEQTTQWVLQSETIVERDSDVESSNGTVKSTLEGDPEPTQVPAVATSSPRPQRVVPSPYGEVEVPGKTPSLSKSDSAVALPAPNRRRVDFKHHPKATTRKPRLKERKVVREEEEVDVIAGTLLSKKVVSLKALRFLGVSFQEHVYDVTVQTMDGILISRLKEESHRLQHDLRDWWPRNMAHVWHPPPAHSSPA